jgi:hypothetical protein
VLIVPGLVLFVLASSQTQINVHFRYVLPTIATLTVFLGRAAFVAIHPSALLALSSTQLPRERRSCLPLALCNHLVRMSPFTFRATRFTVARILVVSAVVATMVSTLHSYPHQLAYFNELAGGPSEGWRHLLGSSFDFGQDRLYSLVRSNRGDMSVPTNTVYLVPATDPWAPFFQPRRADARVSRYIVSRELLAYQPHSFKHSPAAVSKLNELIHELQAGKLRRIPLTPVCDMYVDARLPSSHSDPT